MRFGRITNWKKKQIIAKHWQLAYRSTRHTVNLSPSDSLVAGLGFDLGLCLVRNTGRHCHSLEICQCRVDIFAPEMTYYASVGMLNVTHSFPV